jgi:hypothetical protein
MISNELTIDVADVLHETANTIPATSPYAGGKYL